MYSPARLGQRRGLYKAEVLPAVESLPLPNTGMRPLRRLRFRDVQASKKVTHQQRTIQVECHRQTSSPKLAFRAGSRHPFCTFVENAVKRADGFARHREGNAEGELEAVARQPVSWS